MHYRRESERDMKFNYWGFRLGELVKELVDPRPRGFQGRVQRISEGRHVMIVTIIVLVLGILGLAIGVVQVWISYQQWKHPINVPTS
jgi:hypothetical protein